MKYAYIIRKHQTGGIWELPQSILYYCEFHDRAEWTNEIRLAAFFKTEKQALAIAKKYIDSDSLFEIVKVYQNTTLHTIF